MDIKRLSFFLVFVCSSFLQVTFADVNGRVCRICNESIGLQYVNQRWGSKDTCKAALKLDLLHPDVCYRPKNVNWRVNVTFTKEPENTTWDGSSVVFHCVTNPPALHTFWYYNGRSVSFFENTVTIAAEGKKLTVTHNVYSGNELYGKYTCEVVTEQGVAQKSAWLSGNLTRACSLDFLIKPENIVIESNFHGVLKCKGRSSAGAHTLKWYKLANSGSRIEINGRNAIVVYDDLLFVRAKQAHQGTYLCVIEDVTGCEEIAQAYVTVYRNITQICGTRPLVASQHISRPPNVEKVRGGQPAPDGSAPWMVSICRNGGHFCGGVVLNRYWVATAAHCLVKRKSQNPLSQTITLKFGTDSSTDIQTRQFQRRVIHPYFKRLQTGCDRTTAFSIYDLVLLKLRKPLQFNDFVRPICLPYDEDELSSKLRPGKEGQIFGWESKFDEGLKSAKIPIKDNYDEKCECRDEFPMVFCAGLGSQDSADACKGDSGGPFTIAVNKTNGMKWYLAGLVSSGTPCYKNGNKIMSGIYTNVTYVQDWILETIRDPRKRFSY